MTRDAIIETMARGKCEREGYNPDMEYLGAGEPLWLRFEPEAAADLAALEAAGLAVVPVEPTEAMIDALQSYAVCSGYVPEGYAAMIAAAQGAHKP
jgi:hypothetical protein